MLLCLSCNHLSWFCVQCKVRVEFPSFACWCSVSHNYSLFSIIKFILVLSSFMYIHALLYKAVIFSMLFCKSFHIWKTFLFSANTTIKCFTYSFFIILFFVKLMIFGFQYPSLKRFSFSPPWVFGTLFQRSFDCMYLSVFWAPHNV